MRESDPEVNSLQHGPGGRRSRIARRGAGLGCLIMLLVLCSALGALGLALKSGPVTLSLPGNTALNLGSDNFVLSDYSFQNGTTYFADLKGNDVRNILEFRVLADKRNVEIVLHQATKDKQGDKRLLTVPMP